MGVPKKHICVQSKVLSSMFVLRTVFALYGAGMEEPYACLSCMFYLSDMFISNSLVGAHFV